MCHSCVNSVFPFYSIDNEEFSDLFKNCYLKNFSSNNKCLSLFNTTKSVALTNKNDNAQNNVAKIN